MRQWQRLRALSGGQCAYLLSAWCHAKVGCLPVQIIMSSSLKSVLKFVCQTTSSPVHYCKLAQVVIVSAQIPMTSTPKSALNGHIIL